jgi:chromate transporter
MKSDHSFGDALKVWARIGLFSFGGPAAQIALMHRVLVDERKWLSEERFLHALNFCMLLPGPEAMQLATYAGWRMHGLRGGLAAGLLFVLPGAVVVLALSMLYVAFGSIPVIGALFFGIKAAVLAIVVEALLRVSRRALRQPVIILAAALVGFFRTAGEAFQPAAVRIHFGETLATMAVWLALWLVPVALILLAFGPQHVFSGIAVFFSKLAVVTFGGAYAVLSYLAQEVVQARGWLTTGEMVDGLGLAETTPGPLILVIEYVAYLSAHRFAGGLWGGIAGAAIALWVTFVPCFMWIFAFAPYLDYLRSMPRLSGALAAITAAVVGVILNLSLWFALHVLFEKVTRVTVPPLDIWLPDLASINPLSVLLAVAAALMLLKFDLGVVRTIVVSALAGLASMLLV